MLSCKHSPKLYDLVIPDTGEKVGEVCEQCAEKVGLSRQEDFGVKGRLWDEKGNIR